MSGKSTRGRNAQQSVANIDRQLRALELRKAGVGYQQIADSLGYRGPSGAFKAVHRALRELKREASQELLELEVERLDAMLVAIAQAVRSGNFGAIDRALRISERRARLLGLDAPTHVDVNQTAKHVITLKIGDRIMNVNDDDAVESLSEGRAASLHGLPSGADAAVRAAIDVADDE